MRNATRFAMLLLATVLLPVAAQAADATMPTMIKASDMKWSPNPDAPGVMTSVAWGDPAKGAHGAFHKFPAGFATPLHTHSANTKIVVISGTMAMADKDGKETVFAAGSFYSQPNTYSHVTKCMAGSDCVVYVETDGKWDMKPVVAAKK